MKSYPLPKNHSNLPIFLNSYGCHLDLSCYELNCVFKKRYIKLLTPGPQIVTLFGNSVFTELLKLK